MRSRRLTIAGWMLVCAGAVVGLQIPYFYLHNDIASRRLLATAQQLAAGGSTQGDPAATQTAKAALAGGANGEADEGAASGPAAAAPLTTTVPLSASSSPVLGLLDIPKLHLQAPVLEGTADATLNVGVGHLTGSALPGMPSVCLLAAHNATWFRRIDALQSGDDIRVATAAGTFTYSVIGHRIVQAGSPLPQTAAAELVLESCYPLGALYLTSQRYLVTAVLTGTSAPTRRADLAGASDTSGVGSAPARSGGARSAVQPPVVLAQVPSDLAQQGLLLHENNLPLGTLSYEGSPATAWTESAWPLAVTNAATQLWDAWVHGSEQRRTGDLRAMLSGAVDDASQARNPLFAASPDEVIYTSRVDIALNVQGMRLTAVKMTARLRVDGTLWDLTLTAGAVPLATGSSPDKAGYRLVLTGVSARRPS